MKPAWPIIAVFAPVGGSTAKSAIELLQRLASSWTKYVSSGICSIAAEGTTFMSCAVEKHRQYWLESIRPKETPRMVSDFPIASASIIPTALSCRAVAVAICPAGQLLSQRFHQSAYDVLAAVPSAVWSAQTSAEACRQIKL